MASRKSTSVLALEFGPSTLRFVEMLPGGNPENQVLAAGVLALEAGEDGAAHADRIRTVLSQTSAFRSGSKGGTLIASVPLGHAFVRRIDLPELLEGTDTAADALRWDMAQYLARPLDRYALDFQPVDSAHGPQRFLAAAYRLSEVETLRAAVAEAGGPPLAALDIDALAILNAFAVNYPECLPERSLLIKADVLTTTLFRTQNGAYLGGAVLRDSSGASVHAAHGRVHTQGTQERAEYLLNRAQKIAQSLGSALGGGSPGSQEGWQEAERIFLCGDLAGDADFRELLKTSMREPFALLNPFRKIPGPNPDTYPAAFPGAPFAAVVGLALRAVHAQTGADAHIPRLNLLAHLAASETVPAAPAPKPARIRRIARDPATSRSTAKRLLVALALLILAGAAGLALKHPEWVGRLRNSAPAPALPDTDSLQRSLENEASHLVAGQQVAAIGWLREMETTWAPKSFAGIRMQRAAFTTPDAFVLGGVSQSPEALSALQETLVLVPGIQVRRSEARPVSLTERPAQGLEFLFSGSFSAPQGRSLSSSRGPVSARVLSGPDIHTALESFLDAAAFAGLAFDTLPAGPATASGTLRATPYRLSALGHPAQLREFLENEYRQDSPFGIQRVTLENTADSERVFLDIMAISR